MTPAALALVATYGATATPRGALRHELGWGVPADARERSLARGEPAAVGVRRCCLDPADEDAASASVRQEPFAAWYGDVHRSPFDALFDQSYPEVPVVDV